MQENLKQIKSAWEETDGYHGRRNYEKCIKILQDRIVQSRPFSEEALELRDKVSSLTESLNETNEVREGVRGVRVLHGQADAWMRTKKDLMRKKLRFQRLVLGFQRLWVEGLASSATENGQKS